MSKITRTLTTFKYNIFTVDPTGNPILSETYTTDHEFKSADKKYFDAEIGNHMAVLAEKKTATYEMPVETFLEYATVQGEEPKKEETATPETETKSAE